jgi:predicted dehydrogenase
MKLRAAIVGAGLMGRWHAKNIARAGGEVAAVCDVDERNARSLARSHRARVYAQIADALDPDKIDIVHVCTPLSDHFESAAAALSRGIHVLIEKPMATDRQHTERLYELAAEHRALLCPVHQFPFQAGVQRAVAEFDKIGLVRHFEATFCSAGGMGKSEGELEAIVAEILPHPLSLMKLFAPESLSRKDWVVARPARGEFRAILTAQEVSFSILVSMNSRPTKATLQLLGTQGTINVDLFHGFCLVEHGQVSRWRKIVHPFDLSARTLVAAGGNLAKRALNRELAYPGLQCLIERFYTAVSKGLEPPIRREETIEIAAGRDLLNEKYRAIEVSLSAAPRSMK